MVLPSNASMKPRGGPVRAVCPFTVNSLGINYFLMYLLCIGGGPAGLHFPLLMVGGMTNSVRSGISGRMLR